MIRSILNLFGFHGSKSDNSVKLKKISEDFFNAYFDLHPGAATDLGIPGHDDLLPTYGDKVSNSEEALTKRTLKALKQIPRSSLHGEDHFDYDLFKGWLAGPPKMRDHGRKWYDENHDYKTNPGLYGSGNAEIIFTHVIYPGDSPEADLHHVTSRLMQFPRLVKEGMKNLTHDTPKLWVKNEINQLPSSVDFLKSLPEVYKSTIDGNPELKQKLETGIQAASNALQTYRSFLREQLLPIADGEFAIGPKMLKWKLRNEFHIKQTPVQLETWAKQQIQITKQKMDKLAAEIEPGKTPEQVLSDMEKEHPSPEHLLETYRFETQRARKFITDHHLITMPMEDNIEVIQTPSFLVHENPTAAYYVPRPFAKVSRGTFIATIPGPGTPEKEMEELLGAHNIYAMRNTIVHEAYPGHHVQLSRAKEVKESDLRKLLSNLMETDVKVEGWGLYSEQLMEEAGFVNSPKDQLMRLKWLLHRQIRVLLGVELQSGKLSRDEAVEKFVSLEPGLLRQVAEGEVDYFTQLPLQPLSYAIGLGQILSLRSKMQEKLGNDFSLQAFHDAVANTGNLPLGLVEKRIEHQMEAGAGRAASATKEAA